MKHKTAKYIFLTLYISSIFILFLEQIRNGYSKESWQITEFLINYRGGFARRGFLGEIILILYESIGINPYTAILTISIFSYSFLLLFFSTMFIKKNLPLFMLSFPFLLGGPIVNNFWVRKDSLLVLVFISILYCIQKSSQLSFFIANTFLSVGIIVHEIIGFFTLPLIFLMISKKHKNKLKKNITKNSLLLATISLLPSVLAFSLVLFNKGTTEISEKIWSSWQHINFPNQAEFSNTAPSAINSLSWTLRTSISLLRNTLMNFDGYVYAPAAWGVIVFLIYTIFINIDLLKNKAVNGIKREIISEVMTFQLISILPLFLLGWDYGRWIFFWTTSSLAILLIVPEENLKDMFPKHIKFLSRTLLNFSDNLLKPSTQKLIFIMMTTGIPHHSWKLQEFINNTPLVFTFKRIIFVFSNFFY